MIINVTVENFWSINEQLMFNLTAAKRYKEGMTIPVEKYKMNVLPLCAIYGANGSGKSNLVRAIRLMRDKVVHKSEIAVVPFKFDSEQNEMKPSRFSILFLDKEGEMYQYGFSAIGSDIQDEWLSVYRTQRETMLFERSPSDDSRRSEFSFGNALIKDTKNGRQYLDFVAQGLSQKHLYLSEAAERGVGMCMRIVEWFKEHLAVITPEMRALNVTARILFDPEERECVVGLLKDMDLDFDGFSVKEREIDVDELRDKCASDAQFQSLKQDLFDADERKKIIQFFDRYVVYCRSAENTVIEKRLLISHKRKDGSIAELPIEATSSGFKRMLDFVMLLVDDKVSSKTIVIDEIERSLHTLLAMRFIEQFLHRSIDEGMSGQLVFVTHDTNLLNTDILRRDEIQFMEKDDYSASHLTNLAEFKVIPGLNREKGYLDGRFGAIPILSHTLENLGRCEK